MTCVVCNSIYLRPAESAWTPEGTSGEVSQWARRFACGGCGAVFIIRATRIGTASTDREKNQARHNPPPMPSLAGDNGGTK